MSWQPGNSGELGDPNLQLAINILKESLRKDKEYYAGWKETIAASFRDAYDNYKNNHNPIENWLHVISNDAATGFLTQLMT